MKPPRGLTPEEAAAWAQVASTVKPLVAPPNPTKIAAPTPAVLPAATNAAGSRTARVAPSPPTPPPPPPAMSGNLDASWDRKLARGTLSPDYTLDLHGHTLDTAHGRLLDGVAQARAMGARVVLLITGKPRPAEAADRGTRRGAIRAKVLDWLAASSHAAAIASVRTAHIRHGGEGALYLVLKRVR